MTRPNITPGPWHISSLDQIWDETGEIKVAEICELPRVYIAGFMRPNSQQESANARAIAAVPALLEASEAALKWSGEVPSPYRDWPFIQKARAALTAAGYQF